MADGKSCLEQLNLYIYSVIHYKGILSKKYTHNFTIFQVGDKVQKGQIVCIIEAMKLMNEIEVSLSLTVQIEVG